MKHECVFLCIFLAVLIFLPSCNGNVFVTPDVSAEVNDTMARVTNHLEQDVDYTLEEEIELYKVVFGLVQPKEEKDKMLPDEAMLDLLEYLIPTTIRIKFDFTKIPMIKRETMNALILLDTPQDIAEVNRLLSCNLQHNAARTVNDLYGILKLFVEQGSTENNSSLIEFGNVLNVPADYQEWTYADYIAVQMVLSLILDTIPTAFVNSYAVFEPENEETKTEEYFAKLGDNMVKALLVDDSIILHVLGTYTFLNKYNPSTTILNMRNLGTFFSLEEN